MGGVVVLIALSSWLLFILYQSCSVWVLGFLKTQNCCSMSIFRSLNVDCLLKNYRSTAAPVREIDTCGMRSDPWLCGRGQAGVPLVWVPLRPALGCGLSWQTLQYTVAEVTGAVSIPDWPCFRLTLPAFYVTDFSTDPLILSSISVVLKTSFPRGSCRAGPMMPKDSVSVFLITCFYWKPCFPVLPPRL